MALADGNQNDLAYEVLTNPTYPSFKWMMNNEIDNATTIWESWFFSDGTFSHNHPMYALQFYLDSFQQLAYLCGFLLPHILYRWQLHECVLVQPFAVFI